MATRGRKPKPTQLKKLTGNPGKRPLHGGDEVKPNNTMPQIPRGMPTGARRFWNDYGQELNDKGLLTLIDGPAFLAMALHYDLMINAAKSLKAEGIVTWDERGLVRKHPANQIFRDNSLALKGYLTEFGMTPSARTRVKPDAPKQLSLGDVLAQAIFDGDDDE